MKAIFIFPRYIWLIFAGFFMAFVLYSSTQPAPKFDGVSQSFMDHVLDYSHIPIYALLTFLLLLAFCSFDYRRQMAAFMIAVLFGILNEVVQQYIPGRFCSSQDIINNAIGSLLTIFIVQAFCKKLLKV